MNDFNIIILNTIAYLRGVIFKLSDWAISFDMKYEIFIYLKFWNIMRYNEFYYECRPKVILN